MRAFLPSLFFLISLFCFCFLLYLPVHFLFVLSVFFFFYPCLRRNVFTFFFCPFLFLLVKCLFFSSFEPGYVLSVDAPSLSHLTAGLLVLWDSTLTRTHAQAIGSIWPHQTPRLPTHNLIQKRKRVLQCRRSRCIGAGKKAHHRSTKFSSKGRFQVEKRRKAAKKFSSS